METSAQTGVNVKELFTSAVKEHLDFTATQAFASSKDKVRIHPAHCYSRLTLLTCLIFGS
jgi:hypothetical protein